MVIVKSSHVLHSILYSTNIMTKQRQTSLDISATCSNISAVTARLLDGFSMSACHRAKQSKVVNLGWFYYWKIITTPPPYHHHTNTIPPPHHNHHTTIFRTIQTMINRVGKSQKINRVGKSQN